MQEKKRLILIAIFILTFAIINLILIQPVQAVTQIRSTEIDKIDDTKYPVIKQMIQDLQTAHPNWNFKVLYTGIDWNEAIVKEFVGHNDSPSNLVPVGAAFTGEWICESCTANKYYDNGNWRCASRIALEYMMDARNSINYSDVFQFMELRYQECILENIQPMVEGTFLDNESYINAVIEAGKKHNVSPYYIVALAIQEQGKSGSTTISGTYSGYEGYYNIFNINASGNSKDIIITRALTYAKDKGWDSLEKAIDGGVEKISTSYIARGQDTLYLQKFDVDNSDEKLYWHQYQQNIMAAQNEGVTIRKTFENINSIESAYTFVIPVYENMPETISKKPQKDAWVDTTGAEQVRLNVNTSINLRATPNGVVVGLLYADEIVLRLEQATEKKDGTYWDKVMKTDGTIGYVARETSENQPEYKLYLIPIEDEETENPEETPNEGTEENPETNPDDNTPSDEPNNEPEGLPVVNNEKIKVEADAKQVTIVPGATIEEIIALVGTEVKVTDKDGKELEQTATLGTGCKINDTYTLIVLGDVNGDATVDIIDLALVKRHLMETQKLTGVYYKAGIIQKNVTEIDIIDLALLKRVLMGTTTISF